MASGSFEGLYTFVDVGDIYGIDSSCLRKQVAREKLVEGEDIKKFGKTWVITEQSMVKHFGTFKFEDYKKKQEKKQKLQERKLNTQNSKVKGSKSSKKIKSINEDEEKFEDSWLSGEVKGLELKSFNFSINGSETI